MSSEIALDLRRYDTPAKLGSLVNDTASLSIEASENEGTPRVNPHFFVKRGPDYAIAPGRDKRDVREMFARGDQATAAAEEIVEVVLNDPLNRAYVWISAPKGPWNETRIDIGAKTTTKNGKFEYARCYCISTKLDSQESLLTGQLLISLSPERQKFPADTDELRGIIIKVDIPNQVDPFEYLSKFIDLPEKDSFASIVDGRADKNKVKAIKAAIISTKIVRENPNVIYSSPIRYGAYVETRMRREGYGMATERFGCGTSNTTITNAFSYTENFAISPGEDQYGSLEFACPNCHATNRRPHGCLLSNCQHCGKPIPSC